MCCVDGISFYTNNVSSRIYKLKTVSEISMGYRISFRNVSCVQQLMMNVPKHEVRPQHLNGATVTCYMTNVSQLLSWTGGDCDGSAAV
jgi:hypothetical protein